MRHPRAAAPEVVEVDAGQTNFAAGMKKPLKKGNLKMDIDQAC